MLDERDGRGRQARRADAPVAHTQHAHTQHAHVRDANIRHAGADPAPRDGAPGRSPSGDKPTIMIVDDDDAIREALEDVLSDEGYRIVGMSDGQQALEHLNAEAPPSAILLDLWMPVMDGWKFLDALLGDARFSSIPLVVLTAARDQRARELRVAEVLTKPVQLQQVLSALERLTQAS